VDWDCVELQIGSLELEKFLPKITGESGIIVKENRVRHAMEFEDIVHKNLSHCRCHEWVLERIEMIIFGKVIYYKHDDRLISQFGKTTMKYIEMFVHIVSLIGIDWSVPRVLTIALTSVTFSHKGLDVLFPSTP
jgi:hypothetical protein